MDVRQLTSGVIAVYDDEGNRICTVDIPILIQAMGRGQQVEVELLWHGTLFVRIQTSNETWEPVITLANVGFDVCTKIARFAKFKKDAARTRSAKKRGFTVHRWYKTVA